MPFTHLNLVGAPRSLRSATIALKISRFATPMYPCFSHSSRYIVSALITYIESDSRLRGEKADVFVWLSVPLMLLLPG